MLHEEYELTLKYVKGYLFVVDSLSRAHSDKPPVEDLSSDNLDTGYSCACDSIKPSFYIAN